MKQKTKLTKEEEHRLQELMKKYHLTKNEVLEIILEGIKNKEKKSTTSQEQSSNTMENTNQKTKKSLWQISLQRPLTDEEIASLPKESSLRKVEEMLREIRKTKQGELQAMRQGSEHIQTTKDKVKDEFSLKWEKPKASVNIGGTIDVSGIIEPNPLSDKWRDVKGKFLVDNFKENFKADVERTNEKIKEACKNAKPLSDKWRGIKGKWLSDRFEDDFKADVERNNNIDKIKKTYKKHKPEGAKSWRDLDLAIELYMNLKTQPEHIKEFGFKLKDERQKRILKLSQNLPPKLKKLAIEMQSDYKILGEKALDAGVIRNLLEFYVPQVWDMPKNMSASEFIKKFTLTTSQARHRVIGSILEGWANGLILKVEGATDNMVILKKSINHVIENKQLIQDGLKTVGVEGKPLFITYPTDGYKQIKNPGFVHWEKVEKIENPSKKKLKNNDFIVTKNGTVFLKQKIYALEHIAKELNNIIEDPYKINLLHKLKRKMNLASINFNFKPMKIKKVVVIIAIIVLVFYTFINVYLSTFIGAQYYNWNGKHNTYLFKDKYLRSTLTVTDYSIWHQTFTLNNGKKVHFLLLSTLKKVK